MESSSSSISPNSLLYWNYINLLLVRPILAISFVLFFIIVGWVFAWKLVLVHVPLIQEIFGLRRKPVKPKPTRLGRFSKIYNEINATKSDADGDCEQSFNARFLSVLDPFKIEKTAGDQQRIGLVEFLHVWNEEDKGESPSVADAQKIHQQG